MPISHKYKCIFVHIPKCGGSTIENFLDIARPECFYNARDLKIIDGVEYAPQHFTPGIIKEKLPQYFDNYLKFTFIRSPYHRVLSEYFWRFRHKTKSQDHFERWIDEFYSTIDMDHKLSQYDYLHINDQKCLNLVGCLDNFNELFTIILDYISFKGERNVKIYNKTKKDLKFLTRNAKRKIENIYPKDFDIYENYRNYIRS